MDNTSIYYLIAGVLIVIGLLGTILPVLPGLPVMFAGMLLAAWAGGFAHIGAGTLTALGVLVLLSIGVDLAASILGAKRSGASKKGLWGAGIGGFAGIFFGVPGLVAGRLAGRSGPRPALARRLEDRPGHLARHPHRCRAQAPAGPGDAGAVRPVDLGLVNAIPAGRAA
jgi:hypothetical protein